MSYYVTRDPIRGIEVIDEDKAIIVPNGQFTRLVFRVTKYREDTAVNEGVDWHRTEDAANLRMRVMRVARIKKLQRELAQLKKLSEAAP